MKLLSGNRLATLAVLILTAIAFLIWRTSAPRPENQRAGKFPEELVYVRSEDDIVNGGAMFTPPKDSAKPIAVIWIHGWGVNFYYPTYVMIGRAPRGARLHIDHCEIRACMTLAMSPDGAGKNGSAAAAIGVWPVRRCETSPPGSTSPRRQRIQEGGAGWTQRRLGSGSQIPG